MITEVIESLPDLRDLLPSEKELDKILYKIKNNKKLTFNENLQLDILNFYVKLSKIEPGGRI